MFWEHGKGCTSFYPAVRVKEIHKREEPFALSLEVKVGRLAGGKEWARVLQQRKQQKQRNRGKKVPGGL